MYRAWCRKQLRQSSNVKAKGGHLIAYGVPSNLTDLRNHSIARKTKISDKVTINDFFAPAAFSMRWALFLYYIAFLLIPYVSTYVDLRFGFAILMKAKTKRRYHL